MFHELIKTKCEEWYQSEDCKIKKYYRLYN